MKKHWIQFEDDWKNTPMAFWVHKPVDSPEWFSASVFDPPAPKPNLQGRYPVLYVEHNNHTFVFSSPEQFSEFKTVLSQKLLPTTRSLSEKRDPTIGPNSHWLSKLPADVKPFTYRSKLLKYCETISF